LQQLRRALFQQQPFCVLCRAAGRFVLAEVRDHIVPLTEGGTDAPENVQSLCSSCHQAKTQIESRRGRSRAT
jgi:5-methylcytosine-specific restriction protein A